MAPVSSEFEREMQQLEVELKRLEAEYNMFFAGRLPRLPWETRARVEALIKRYDRMPNTNTAQRFRFGSLQARFVAFCELWERSLQAREGTRPVRGRGQKEPAKAPAAAAPPAAPPASREKLVHVARFSDPSKETDRLHELYDRLAKARDESGEAQIPFHRFAEVVRAQVEKVGGGSGAVSFQVAKTKEGKVTLTVKKEE